MNRGERNRAGGLLLLAAFMIAIPAMAAKPVFEINISNHLFEPSEIMVPADTKVKLIIYNHDATPEEFESYNLNREKVIMGTRKAVIFIGPLKRGSYPFFGEFHPKTAQGTIVAE